MLRFSFGGPSPTWSNLLRRPVNRNSVYTSMHTCCFSSELMSLTLLNTVMSVIFTDCINMGGNAIALYICLCPFPVFFSNQLTFGVDLLHMCWSLPWLAGIETEGLRLGLGSRYGQSGLDPRSMSVF